MQLFFPILTIDILSFCIGLYFLKYLPIAFKIVLLQIFMATISEVYGRYLGTTLHQQNVWFFNLYWFISDLWLMGIAGIILINNKKTKKIFLALLVITSIIWLGVMYQNGIHSFSPLILLAIFVSVTTIYFAVLFQDTFFSNEGLLKIPSLWLCLSVILFFGCNIPYTGLFNYLNENDPETLKTLFNITNILNLIRYPMVAISFYLLGRQGMAAKQKLA